MPRYKLDWDTAAKSQRLPVGTSQKAVVLKLDDKSEETKVWLGGILYCYVNGDNHWVIGAEQSTFLTHATVPSLKKEGEKWVKDPNLEKTWVSSFEDNHHAFALCVDGHAGAMAMVKYLDGKCIDADCYLNSTEGEAVTTYLKAVENGETPETSPFEGAIAILSLEEALELRNHKKMPLFRVECEGGKPTVLPHLPSVKASSGKGSYGGGKPGFLATADRVKEVLAFKGDTQFDDLFAWYQSEPAKVSFALALTGVAITLPTVAISQEVSTQQEDAEGEDTEKK